MEHPLSGLICSLPCYPWSMLGALFAGVVPQPGLSPSNTLGPAPAGPGVRASQCSEALMSSPVQDSSSLVDRPDPASLTHVSSRLYFKGTTR